MTGPDERREGTGSRGSRLLGAGALVSVILQGIGEQQVGQLRLLVTPPLLKAGPAVAAKVPAVALEIGLAHLRVRPVARAGRVVDDPRLAALLGSLVQQGPDLVDQ